MLDGEEYDKPGVAVDLIYAQGDMAVDKDNNTEKRNIIMATLTKEVKFKRGMGSTRLADPIGTAAVVPWRGEPGPERGSELTHAGVDTDQCRDVFNSVSHWRSGPCFRLRLSNKLLFFAGFPNLVCIYHSSQWLL